MVDNTFTRQNDALLLQCQLAQRNEYTKAKVLMRWRAIATLGFAVFSVLASILNVDWFSALSSFLAVALALYNKHSNEAIKGMKKHAASIQQYIDATIFAPEIGTNISDWGDIPSKSDIADAVSKCVNKDTSEFVNWYSDYSSLNGESQVFHCQRENLRWDYDLHNTFKKLCMLLFGLIVFIFLIVFLVFDPSFVKVFCIMAWFLPIAEYGCSEIKAMNESISILRDAVSFANQLEKRLETGDSRTVRRKLIMLQHKIQNRRVNGYLIPDWFYKCQKSKHQKKEDEFANTIRHLDK